MADTISPLFIVLKREVGEKNMIRASDIPPTMNPDQWILATTATTSDEIDHLIEQNPGDYVIYEAKGRHHDDGLPPRFELRKEGRIRVKPPPPPKAPKVETVESFE